MKLTGLISLFFLLLSFNIFASSDLALIQNRRPTRPEEFNFYNWRKNLRIGYFGDYTFTTLKKLDDNQYNSDGTKNPMPISLLNEFNITYNVTPKLALYTKPEFYVVTGDRNDLDDSYDRNLVTMGDLLLGFQYRAYRGPKVNYNIRVTHGHPFSKYSRDQQINSETDFQNFIIWFPTRKITMLIWNTYRYYFYDSEVNSKRYRINNRFIFSYNWNDKWGYQFNSEFVLQHRSRKEGPGQRKWNHFSVYRNTLSWGVTYKLSNYLTLIPNVEAQDLENVRWETLQFGVTFLGRVF